MITISRDDLFALLTDVAELGASRYAAKIRPQDNTLSQRKAYEIFGSANVKRWRKAGNVSVTRKGGSVNSKITYRLDELLTADNSDRLTCINNKLQTFKNN